MNKENERELETKVEVSVLIIQAVAETIRDLGEVPSGKLYAQLTGKFELHQYEQVIGILKRTGLVTETPGCLLRWNGSKSDERTGQ